MVMPRTSIRFALASWEMVIIPFWWSSSGDQGLLAASFWLTEAASWKKTDQGNRGFCFCNRLLMSTVDDTISTGAVPSLEALRQLFLRCCYRRSTTSPRHVVAPSRHHLGSALDTLSYYTHPDVRKPRQNWPLPTSRRCWPEYFLLPLLLGLPVGNTLMLLSSNLYRTTALVGLCWLLWRAGVFCKRRRIARSYWARFAIPLML